MSTVGGRQADDLLALVTAALPAATPEALGMLLLRGDPQFARIDIGAAQRLVEAALEDGRRLASVIRLTYGVAPAVIAERNAVRVVEVREAHDYGTTVVYAEYTERPPQIRLFLPAIRALNRWLTNSEFGGAMGLADVAPVFLAHELYHHLDCLRDTDRLVARHRVPLLRLGPVHWTTGLASLPEIAAGAFAQHLLGLRYHPKILDLITLFHADPRGALRMVESLQQALELKESEGSVA
jgi:hypothetical protein